MVFVLLVNAISSTYFAQLTLAGIVFLSFIKTLDKEYYFSFMVVVLSFLFIEANQGIQLFSLTIYALVLYYLVIPYLDKVFTIETVRNFVHLIGFYLGLLVWFSASEHVQWELIVMIFINAVLDIALAGVLL